MADSMSYLYTIGGYATLFGVGYVIYQVSTQKNRKRATAGQAKVAPKATPAEPRKEDRKKKQRKDNFVSGAQEAASKVSKPQTAAKVPDSIWENTSDSDDVDNREFARQLAKAKEGTKFATKADGGKQREKSVKQSRANKITNQVAEKESAPSSTTGADADDDQSPPVSPQAGPAEAGDISDMLESTTRSGPSILRLTDTAPKKQNKKPAKAPEPVETKKQRQNRKKAEAAKAARQEAEQDRKVLEEKQRRTARIAEGRAAKDGSQFTAAAIKNSVWTQDAPAPAPITNGLQLHQPLDTFEVPTVASVEAVAPVKAAEDNWAASLPSEEEQMEMLKSDEDEWSTVKTKSKKASKKETPTTSGDELSHSRPTAQPKQPSTGGKAPKASQSFGSFSALNVQEVSEDDNQEEEEWDV